MKFINWERICNFKLESSSNGGFDRYFSRECIAYVSEEFRVAIDRVYLLECRKYILNLFMKVAVSYNSFKIHMVYTCLCLAYGYVV